MPGLEGFTTDGAKFINFDNSTCAAIVPCAQCSHNAPNDVGAPSLFRRIEYVNSPNKVSHGITQKILRRFIFFYFFAVLVLPMFKTFN